MMKMCLKNKILSFVFVLAIFSLSFCCVEKVYAEELETTLCEFTDEYIAWNKLSDEEKKNTTKPPMCDYDATEYNRVKTNINTDADSITQRLYWVENGQETLKKSKQISIKENSNGFNIQEVLS